MGLIENMKIKLIEKQPMMYRGVPTFYSVGELFEVLDTKKFPKTKDTFYKIKSLRWNIILDGWINSNGFEELKEDNPN